MVHSEPFENSRATGTTPGGTAHVRIDLAFGARLAYVYVPTRVAAWTHTTMLSIIHGATGDRTFAEGALGKPHLDAALDRGWIAVAPSTGDTWGNAQAMTDLRNLYNYVASRWWIDNTVTVGHSMGGMASVVVGGRSELPDLAGVASINGMLDTQDYHSPQTLTAYGAATWEELPAKQAGYDPVRDDPERWRGLPVCLVSSTGDTSARQADLFVGRAVTPELIEHLSGTHSHLQNPFAVQLDAFLASLAPAYMDGQPITTQPVPKWPGWDTGGPGAGASGLRRTNGTEVGLSRTDGSPVQV